MTDCTPENGYPENWQELSEAIRLRSGGRCECRGHCGLHRERRCCEINGGLAVFAAGSIVLTVAHLDHDPGNSAWGHYSNLTGGHPAPGWACACGWSGASSEFVGSEFKACPSCGGSGLVSRPNNLLAMCQRCHLLYDVELHALHRARNAGALHLPEPELRALALRLHRERVESYRSQLILPGLGRAKL